MDITDALRGALREAAPRVSRYLTDPDPDVVAAAGEFVTLIGLNASGLREVMTQQIKGEQTAPRLDPSALAMLLAGLIATYQDSSAPAELEPLLPGLLSHEDRDVRAVAAVAVLRHFPEWPVEDEMLDDLAWGVAEIRFPPGMCLRSVDEAMWLVEEQGLEDELMARFEEYE
ncbi:MAG: hypothetical protein H6718_28405 [Polyangiaceae bacterium]|nr:hypothetical protein [Polyangiaceae bacterium]